MRQLLVAMVIVAVLLALSVALPVQLFRLPIALLRALMLGVFVAGAFHYRGRGRVACVAGGLSMVWWESPTCTAVIYEYLRSASALRGLTRFRALLAYLGCLTDPLVAAGLGYVAATFLARTGEGRAANPNSSSDAD